MNIKYQLRDAEIERLRKQIHKHEVIIHHSTMRIDALRDRIKFLKEDEEKHLKRDMEEKLSKKRR